MTRRIFFTLCVFCLSNLAFSQENVPKKINYQELENRIRGQKDTIFIINFWATWCKPCVEEMPLIDNISSTYQGKPVKVLLVSLDFPDQIEGRLKSFVQKKHIINEVLVLDESNPNSWISKVSDDWSGAIPSCWFLYQGREEFYEGQITPEIIDQRLNSLL